MRRDRPLVIVAFEDDFSPRARDVYVVYGALDRTWLSLFLSLVDAIAVFFLIIRHTSSFASMRKTILSGTTSQTTYLRKSIGITGCG